MIGLQNLGNTCYMNSAIQLLMNCNSFKKMIKNNKNKSENLNIIYNFIKEYESANRYITPKDLKNMVGKRKQLFGGFGQQDSHEFLIFLFDIIDEDLKINNNSELYDIFGLEFLINFKCKILNCLNESEHIEKELFLNLDLSDNLDNSYRNYKQIVKLIDDNMYMCEKCNMKRPGRKLIVTKKWSKDLIIVLKRFNNNLIKNNNDMDIPLEWRHGYRLKGGILHSGSLNGGHYVYFGMKNNEWYLFNDSNVSTINNINNYLKKAYILHYEKIFSDSV